jgi:molybdopterin/thiamine biosynthesis adenylyltransferase
MANLENRIEHETKFHAAFTDGQLERYSRHIILKEVGVKGQKRIMGGKVLIIGAGGLGAPAAMYLAAAGVGTIGIADADSVDLSNLQRQIIHSTPDVGKPKVDSSKETMNAMNPDVEVVTYHEWIDSTNIKDIIGDRNYDFVIDGTDNFPVKFLINDACVMLGKPFSHAGIIRFQGQLLTYIPKEPTGSKPTGSKPAGSKPAGSKGPCYRCVFREPPPPDAVPTCRQAGVLGVMGGVIGTLQATEALKYLLGMEGLLNGYLLTYTALTMEFRKVKLAHNPDCRVCGTNPVITTLVDYKQAVCDLKQAHGD